MATDTEEFEYAIILVCKAYESLCEISRNHPLLSHITLEKVGFQPNQTYEPTYVRPHLRSPDGQLYLWDWAYPNQFKARLSGLIGYWNDLNAAIKTETSKRGLDRLVCI